jgi:hypothetical protein
MEAVVASINAEELKKYTNTTTVCTLTRFELGTSRI